MTFAHWDLALDAVELHEHHHGQEEVWNVVEGEVVLVVDGQERRLDPGTAAVVMSASATAMRASSTSCWRCRSSAVSSRA